MQKELRKFVQDLQGRDRFAGTRASLSFGESHDK